MADSIIKRNALADPSYCPYCLRCKELVRMTKISHLLWGCLCGAIHDERDDAPNVTEAPRPPIDGWFRFGAGSRRRSTFTEPLKSSIPGKVELKPDVPCARRSRRNRHKRKGPSQ